MPAAYCAFAERLERTRLGALGAEVSTLTIVLWTLDLVADVVGAGERVAVAAGGDESASLPAAIVTGSLPVKLPHASPASVALSRVSV